MEETSKGKARGPVYKAGEQFECIKEPKYDPWTLDSELRQVLTLIELQDLHELHLRIGASDKPGEVMYLPVIIQLKRPSDDPESKNDEAALVRRFSVPSAYFDERARNRRFNQVTGLIRFDAKPDRQWKSLEAELQELQKYAERVSLAVPIAPSGEVAVGDIGMPAGRKFNGKDIDGHGVVIGIIDDGCALAHWNFLEPYAAGSPPKSRIKYLWDQAGTGNQAAGWTPIPKYYGMEIDQAAINAVLASTPGPRGDVLDEDKVYDKLGYKITDLASHGTHVMDIAAGNGKAMMGSEGVAPAADIIFVQLAQVAIEAGKDSLMKGILDGVQYIFDRATAMGQPAVVNISYGTYGGPHDGTGLAEVLIDNLLLGDDRAVVVAAGNGFEADCHAEGVVHAKRKKKLRWIVRPEDPSPNDLEIWYSKNDKLDLYFTSPDGQIALGPISSKTVMPILRGDGKVIGKIDHGPDAGNGDFKIAIKLRATTADAENATLAPAPSGEWLIELDNPAPGKVAFHAWIERDDAGRSRNARKRQSHFHGHDSYPGCTLFGLATGHRVISVGAYNTATGEVCRYSAAGPTRDNRGMKPDVCAPAEEDVAGRGVLSASSRKSTPTRMAGTSASAPHVTGLVALMLQYNKDIKNPPLSADKIAKAIRDGAAKSSAAPLLQNRHQLADAKRPLKQGAVWNDVVGAGKIDVLETLKLI